MKMVWRKVGFEHVSGRYIIKKTPGLNRLEIYFEGSMIEVFEIQSWVSVQEGELNAAKLIAQKHHNGPTHATCQHHKGCGRPSDALRFPAKCHMHWDMHDKYEARPDCVTDGCGEKATVQGTFCRSCHDEDLKAQEAAAIENQLDACADIDDIKEFIREHLMKGQI